MISSIVSGYNTSTMTTPRGPTLTPPRHHATTTNHSTPPTLQRTTNNSNIYPTNTTTLFTCPPSHKPSISIPHSHRRPPHATTTPITYHSPRTLLPTPNRWYSPNTAHSTPIPLLPNRHTHNTIRQSTHVQTTQVTSTPTIFTTTYNKNALMKHMNRKRNNCHNRHNNKIKLHKKLHNQLIDNSIINLSDTPLTKSATNLLSKGLKFIPSPKPTHFNTIYNSFLKYRRNMYNKYFFRDNQSIIHPFRTRSKFTPPPPDNSNLTEYISQIYHDLKTQHTQQKQHKPSVTSTDLHYINQLKNNNDIIIKPADKGGAIVIWPKKDYLTEAYKQLNNTNHYQRITDDPTPQIQQQMKTLVKKMHDDQLIDDTTNKFLSPENTTNTIPTTQNTQTQHTRKTNPKTSS